MMKSTRDRILQTLLEHPQSTVVDLANAVNINAISVRHHLSSLLAEGLVSSEEIRHGVGRPRQVFSLTEDGLERFPSRYLRLTSRLLDQLKQSLPEETVKQIFQEMGNRLAASYSIKGRQLSLKQKIDLLKDLLSEEGFFLDVQASGDQFIITEASCPYIHIGQNHPELCTLDETLISSILSTPVEKLTCILKGDAQCKYLITPQASQEAQSS